ncbi:hypothetical protein [Desulfosarcina sp.]|uniref:hypothetical protein n=1 Tax=Desulfosarcina sp. TaxID=2027861 RepID=UPI0039708783
MEKIALGIGIPSLALKVFTNRIVGIALAQDPKYVNSDITKVFQCHPKVGQRHIVTLKIRLARMGKNGFPLEGCSAH